MKPSILHVEGLTKIFQSKPWFGQPQSFLAVDNISFSIFKGEIVGLLGPNGAGKSTTMQMLLDALTPTSGKIFYFGKNLAHSRIEIMQKMGFATAYSRMPGRLTVYENLRIYGKCYGLSGKALDEKIVGVLRSFDAYQLLNKQAAELSAGQMTRVILAKAFLADPEIVLLDEPTASLDPESVHVVRHFLLEQQRLHNTTILIASHDMDEVAELCDRLLVIKNGVIIASDTPTNLAGTVANARIHLTITSNADALIHYLNDQSIIFTQTDKDISVFIEEVRMNELLNACARLEVRYSHISFEKPSLEDYFLTIARERK